MAEWLERRVAHRAADRLSAPVSHTIFRVGLVPAHASASHTSAGRQVDSLWSHHGGQSPNPDSDVDDHALLREGIAALIAGELDMTVVGAAATGREAVEQFRALRPDVTLMNLQMPDLSGLDALIDTGRIDVLQLMAAGNANKPIADYLGVTEDAVKGRVRKPGRCSFTRRQ